MHGISTPLAVDIPGVVFFAPACCLVLLLVVGALVTVKVAPRGKRWIGAVITLVVGLSTTILLGVILVLLTFS